MGMELHTDVDTGLVLPSDTDSKKWGYFLGDS